jgi:4a-hydroxytetrahydrobiopterin dehydratase
MSGSDRMDSRELENILANRLVQWTKSNGALVRTIEFADFNAALGFVNAVGEKAEMMGHHPDIDMRYNKVTLTLTSHDAGGISWRDIALASHIDQLAPKYQARKIA